MQLELPETGNSPELTKLIHENLPGLVDAEVEFRKLKIRTHDRLGQSIDTEQLLDTPLDDDERKRRRFRGHIASDMKQFGPRYGPFLTLGLHCIKSQLRSKIVAVMHEIGCYSAKTTEQLRFILGELSTYAKKYGQLVWGEDWKMFHGLDLGGGYLKVVPIENFVDDIREWSEEISKIQIPLSEFRDGVDDCLRMGKYDPKGIPMKEWAQQYSWARPGSSDGKRLRLDVDGTERKARKSKNATALAMSPEEVEKELLRWEHQKNKAVQKRELGKVRAVVAGGLTMYLQMSYIDSWLFEGLRGTEWSTLFYSSEQMSRLWTNLGTYTIPSVRVPLDQSKFDHQALKEMVLETCRAIKDLIRKTVTDVRNRADMLAVMDRILYALSAGGTWVGNTFVPYKNGVLSGWKWTALIDSVINWAELFAARKRVERIRGGDPVREAVVQGDDSRVVCANNADALALIQAYNDYNIVINPKKFFVSSTRDEYLRKVGESGVTAGYYWRTLSAIFWRNPVSRDPLPGELRMKEQLTSWMAAVSRGGELKRVLPLMVKDMSAGNHLSGEEVDEWLETAASLGGGGLGMKTEGLKIFPGVRKPVGVRILPTGATNYLSRITKIPEVQLCSMLLDRVELPPQVRWEQEKRPEVQRVKALLGPKRQGTHTVMIRPSWVGIPTWIVGAVIDYHKLHDPDGITRWLDESSRISYLSLKEHGSRGVLWSWLEGKLPSGIPVIPGWSTAWLSTFVQDKWTKLMSGALGLSKVRMSDLKQAALGAELWCRTAMETYAGVRVGE